MKKFNNVWEAAAANLDERDMDFDTSDTDSVGRNVAPHRPGAVKQTSGPMPGAPRQNPTSHLPGLPPQKMKREARPRTDTIPLPMNFDPAAGAARQAAPGIIDTGVTNPEDPRFANAPEYQAAPMSRRQSMPTRQIPIRREGTGCANGAGFQAPIGDAAEAAKRTYAEMVEEVFIETVRKLPNGKYGVYMKNKGKRKAPKKVGEYPDKVAAREAELARGGKSGEAAKKERDRLNKLKKDPKKLAAAKAKDKKAKKESIVASLVDGLNEALFREEDVPGSTWDERLAGLSPTALASNKRLMGHTKNIHKASVASLMDAHRGLAKALRKHGKVVPGDIGTETGGKMYMPCMLHAKGDGGEHGPIYLYVDGGHVKMETDGEMDESLDKMDEGEGHKLRGAMQAFQQKDLPKIDGARIAVAKRDADLDKMEKEHDAELSGRDGLSLHLLKTLIGTKHGRRYR